MSEPYRHPLSLWLAPWCDGCATNHYSGDDGRTWCEDNVFEPCEECGRVAEKYVLAPTSDPPELGPRCYTIDLPIPHSVEEREAYRIAAWDRWYDTLPADLRRKLSLHDFKRLGDCFKRAFGIREILPPPATEQPELGMVMPESE